MSIHSLSSPAPAAVYHFKILVPPAAAGRIIGKGGATIEQLQKAAGARVKMSKASEFYPGTSERVCLISGPILGILKINDFFMDNISSSSIKILVPDSTAGMIIGKGGSYIKQIKEESGAYVQMSQKCTDMTLPERCITIVGEPDSIRKACAMILLKIADDVGSQSTYRDMRASSTPVITPVMNPNAPCHQQQHPIIRHQSPQLPQPVTSQAQQLQHQHQQGQHNSHLKQQQQTLSQQIIESMQLVLRVSGYGESAVSEITSAMSTLADYGVLGVGLGLS